MDLSLNDKVMLVTGGASGIGEAIVRQLDEEGAISVILDRDSRRGAEVNGSLRFGEFHACDLTDEASVAEVIKTVLTAHGRLDGVVNNAGVNDSIGLNHSPADFRASLERNLVQCFTVVHYAAEALKRSKGSIVNIGSKVAFTGQGNTSGYAAAKGGLAALTREWALDLAKDGVRSNAVIPAEVWTPMYNQFLSTLPNPAARRAEIEQSIPLGKRMTTTDEIASMVVFLLSARSNHTTGQIVHVDGGYMHLDRAYRG